MTWDREMTTAFVPEDMIEQSLIESVLQEAGVHYVTRNAGVQNLLGIGQIGGVNLVTGPVDILVARSDLSRAQELVESAREESPSLEEGQLVEPLIEDEESSEEPLDELAARYSRQSVIWSVLWLGGLGSMLAIYFGIRALAILRGKAESPRAMAVFGISLGLLGLAVWLIFWVGLSRH